MTETVDHTAKLTAELQKNPLLEPVFIWVQTEQAPAFVQALVDFLHFAETEDDDEKVAKERKKLLQKFTYLQTMQIRGNEALTYVLTEIRKIEAQK